MKNKKVDYYNIIIASDHGARNLDFINNKQDWYSTLYAERIIGKKYRKINDIMPSQLLFSNFFNEDNKKKPRNMIYNHKSSYYELLND